MRVSWRQHVFYKLVHRAVQDTLGRPGFRIVHVSIQDTHLHMLVEANGRRALTRGMQSFTIRLARHVHERDGGCGKVFKYRYHATQIRTASHARHALAYVLNNWRRHNLDLLDRSRAKLDEFSSAVSFRGWSGRTFRIPDGHDPLPVSPAQSRLLVSEWKRFGLIRTDERPGPLA